MPGPFFVFGGLMNVLEILEGMHIVVKRVSLSKGGEYAGPCPYCVEGEDRFRVWPDQSPEKGGRYWCRRCEKSGDGIQLLRDFKGMGFKEACDVIGHSPQYSSIRTRREIPKPVLNEVFEEAPPTKWVESATSFSLFCHEALFEPLNPGMKELEKRRINVDTARRFKLGWNCGDKYPLASDWGLIGDEFQGKKLIIPRGLVIPSFWKNSIERVRVRRIGWKKGDNFGKYQVMSGGRDSPCVIGDPRRYLFILESELDGMILAQEAPQVPVVCLGSSTANPTFEIASIIRKSERVIFIPDIDDAGAKAYAKWKNHFSNVSYAVVPCGGSVGDFHENGGDVANWINNVLER